MNREEWLTELAKMTEPLFGAYRLDRLPYRVSCGWPVKHGLATRHRRIGECHYPAAGGEPAQIFVSPLLGDAAEVAGVVAHELVHVVAGKDAGHKGGFVRVARAVGLTKGPPRSAGPGPELEGRLTRMAERLGPYPHSAIKPLLVPVKAPRPVVAAACPACDYALRVPAEVVSAVGPPTCGCGRVMEVPEGRG